MYFIIYVILFSQTVALLAYLLEAKGVKGPHLVIVPLSYAANILNRWIAHHLQHDWKLV